MQGYIDNEVNLNAENSCSGTCNNYRNTRNYNCQNETLCGHRNFMKTRCLGEVLNCNTIDTNGIACLVVHKAKIFFFYM